MRPSLLFAVLFFAFSILFAAVAGAQTADAVMYLKPASAQFGINSESTLEVRINTAGKNVVAASASITYNALLLDTNASMIDTSGSAFNIEIEKSGNGVINISMGSPGDSNWSDSDDGFTGDGLLGKVTLYARGVGNASLDFAPGSAIILDDGLGTDILGSTFGGVYEIVTPTCTENWVCSGWSSCSANGTQTRACYDIYACGTTFYKPPATQSCAVECTENWICGGWGMCANGAQDRTCSDANACGTTYYMPATVRICITGNVCGNAVCESGEAATCPADCAAQPTCGNAVCELGEDSNTCVVDCPVPPPTEPEMALEILVPGTVESGEPFVFTARIANAALSATYSLKIEDNFETGEMHEHGTRKVPLLKGESAYVNFTGNAPKTRGAYTVVATLTGPDILLTDSGAFSVEYKPLFLEANMLQTDIGGELDFTATSDDAGAVTIVRTLRGGEVIYEKNITGAAELKDKLTLDKKGEYTLVATMYKDGVLVDEDLMLLSVKTDFAETQQRYLIMLIIASLIVVVVSASLARYIIRRGA